MVVSRSCTFTVGLEWICVLRTSSSELVIELGDCVFVAYVYDMKNVEKLRKIESCRSRL